MTKGCLICILLAATSIRAQTPEAAEQARALALLKDYALNYTGRLPDFVCLQITQRAFKPNAGSSSPPQRDAIEEQVTYAGQKESYAVMKLNGKEVTGLSHYQLGGIVSSGEFGSLLKNTFDPNARTEFRWQRPTIRDGQKVYVFAFRVPETRGYRLVESNGTISVPYKGLVYADPQTGAVVRIEMECEIPDASEYKRLELAVDYKPAQVAGREFILPFHFHMRTRQGPNPFEIAETINEADYKNYRRFDANSSVTFPGEANPR